jgi:hypothetical protein
VHDPIATDAGQRVAGLRLGEARAHALLQVLLVFRLLPHGFRQRTLGACSPNCSASPTSAASAPTA